MQSEKWFSCQRTGAGGRRAAVKRSIGSGGNRSKLKFPLTKGGYKGCNIEFEVRSCEFGV